MELVSRNNKKKFSVRQCIGGKGNNNNNNNNNNNETTTKNDEKNVYDVRGNGFLSATEPSSAHLIRRVIPNHDSLSLSFFPSLFLSFFLFVTTFTSSSTWHSIVVLTATILFFNEILSFIREMISFNPIFTR